MGSWYVLQLKHRYSKDTSRKQFYNRLRQRYKFCSKDIFMSIDNYNDGMNHYVFLYSPTKEQLKQKLLGDKYIEQTFGINEITNQQMMDMRKGLEGLREDICFGDVVMVKNGIYNKLYGIVLRERNEGRYQIGLKFCYGVKISLQQCKDLQVVGNIFNHLKVKR